MPKFHDTKVFLREVEINIFITNNEKLLEYVEIILFKGFAF